MVFQIQGDKLVNKKIKQVAKKKLVFKAPFLGLA